MVVAEVVPVLLAYKLVKAFFVALVPFEYVVSTAVVVVLALVDDIVVVVVVVVVVHKQQHKVMHILLLQLPQDLLRL